ncbi:MAG: VOC family protein [Gammaproteobacteria bacterium]|nr:VOC family protein [Gammaproteobacteria bacterium]NNC96665.1 VOC family protein [Gammaproteobacteria bacterium]NNM13215.1 VOC family protein [Gammaproteobacteria bacterium]
MSIIKRIHHVAYRCKDAKQTVEFYKEFLDMDYQLAFAENHVPSTGEYDPYMHVFLDAGMGNVLAFFELPEQPEMGRDGNTPDWVQHIAFEVDDEKAMLNIKQKVQQAGIKVVGPTDHTLFQSIYFFDPNGHRLEITYNSGTPEQYQKLRDISDQMLEEWSKTKKAPEIGAWVHQL